MTALVTLNARRPLIGGPTLAVIHKGEVVIRLNEGDLRLVAAVVDEMLEFARIQVAKARLPRTVRQRDELLAKTVPGFRDALVEYFGQLLRRAGIRKDDAASVDPADIDWDAEEVELRKVIAGLYDKLGNAAYQAIADELSVDIEFDLEAPSTAGIRAAIATKVTGITATTREVITRYVEAAVERGYSIEQLVNGVDDDGFLGLGAIFGERAQTIALTETATAYNLAGNAAYRDSGLVETVLVFDGPECGWTEHDDPDLADGSVRTLDDADEYPTSHPNCQRAFGPIVSDGSDE